MKSTPYTLRGLIAPFLVAALFVPLYASAQDASPRAKTATSSGISFTMCQQDAVEIRDSAIGVARTAYSEAMNKALDYRKGAVKLALELESEEDQNDAKKKVADEYRILVKKAQDDVTRARTEAWDMFEDNMERCREAKKDGTPVTLLKKATTTVEVGVATTSLDQSGLTHKKNADKNFFKEQLEALRNLFKKDN